MLFAEQVVRFIFRRRRAYSIPRRFGVQLHAGMCEHVGCRADELLALVTGLVAGNLQELSSLLTMILSGRSGARTAVACGGAQDHVEDASRNQLVKLPLVSWSYPASALIGIEGQSDTCQAACW